MNAELISLIIPGIAFIIGLIILFLGVTLKKHTIQLFGVCLVGAAGIGYFIKSQEVRDILVAFAVVFATVLSAYNIYETKRITVENRKDRLINEIKDWALEAGKTAVYRQTRKPDVLWAIKLYLYQQIL